MIRTVAFVGISLALLGQGPSFEAASVRTAVPSPGRGRRSSSSGDRFNYANTTLANIVARAYRVTTYQIEGPSWIRTERYDIIAKAPDNTPKEQIPLMLQALLLERFQLKLHREQRDIPVYDVIAGRGKPKFQQRRCFVVRSERRP